MVVGRRRFSTMPQAAAQALQVASDLALNQHQDVADETKDLAQVAKASRTLECCAEGDFGVVASAAMGSRLQAHAPRLWDHCLHHVRAAYLRNATAQAAAMHTLHRTAALMVADATVAVSAHQRLRAAVRREVSSLSPGALVTPPAFVRLVTRRRQMPQSQKNGP